MAKCKPKKKTCTFCSKSKPINEFRFTEGEVRRSRCNSCEAELSRQRRKAARKPTPKVEFMQKAPASKVYVITYAQNATPVHRGFMASLEQYCRKRKALLLALPGHYRNPTSHWSKRAEHDDWWAKELEPYLFGGRLTLGKHLTVYGDISTQPTAVRPLTGFEVFAGANSAVFGHPKLQLLTVATAKRRYPRLLTTTGAVTLPNYTDSKAGKKGEAHHVFGATVVEQGETLFHVRQINALKDGTFIDLDTKYTPQGSEPAPRALGLVCGDIHVDRSEEAVLQATFDRSDSVVRVLNPKTIVCHDVLDFEVRNHHTIDNFRQRYQRAIGNRHDVVEEEVDRAIAFIDSKTPDDSDVVVVASNHDEAFDRWLNTANPKADPINARFFHEVWNKMFEYQSKHGKFPGAFELIYRERGKREVRFLGREEPLKIGGSYCNFHGDKGPNGAKGSILGYSKLGVKTVIGHLHSPGILDGAVQVGVTGRLDQGYNFTPSSWMHSHCVIYANGKRCLINVVDGEWRG